MKDSKMNSGERKQEEAWRREACQVGLAGLFFIPVLF